MGEDKIQTVFYNIRQRQKQQRRKQNAIARAPQGQGQHAGKQKHRNGIQAVRHIGGGTAQGLGEQIVPDVPAVFLGQLQGLLRGLRLRPLLPPGQTAHLLPVAAAGILLHVGVVPGGVLVQQGLQAALPLQKTAPVDGLQRAQAGKQGLERRRVLLALRHRPRVLTELGQTAQQGPGQSRSQQRQLPLRQGDLTLELGQIQLQPLQLQLRSGPHRPPGAHLHHALLHASAHPAAAAQDGGGVHPHPLGQVVVVQQPLHRRGLPRRRRVGQTAHSLGQGAQILPDLAGRLL